MLKGTEDKVKIGVSCVKKRVIIVLIFVFLLGLTNVITFQCTSKYYNNIYKIKQWVQQQYLHVESFDVYTNETELSMFNNNFDLHINIKGYFRVHGSGYEKYIDRLHISERLETIDDKTVAIIKLTPILVSDLKKPVYDYKEAFSYDYIHKLHAYEPYKINTYIIECEGYSQTIEINSNK